MNTPNHLGGHLNKVHTDRGALLHIKDKFNIKSMLDVGCGPGWMLEIAQARGMRAIGIDGDISLRGEWKRQEITVVEQDFTLGPADIGKRKFDLGWSVEFLEHVDEKYIDNYMQAFKRCKYLAVTAAPPGHGGHHHVNEQSLEYWVHMFSEYGFEYDPETTKEMKEASTMTKGFMQKNGMFYVKS
tara:strand:- start:937 stop:1491 length:555 start_codon:yes stop_codon:yes gene_type:complete